MKSYIIIGLIALFFMLLDFASGIAKALATGTFKSTKMREGLYHKVGLIICMVMGWGVDFAQRYLDIGITVPVFTAICAYIVLMEIFSIIENVCEINPDIMPEKLLSILGGLKKSESNVIEVNASGHGEITKADNGDRASGDEGADGHG